MNTLSTHQPKIIRKTSPYLRRPQASVKRMMGDVVIALLPVVAFAIYSFGMDAVKIILTAIGSMVLTEYLYYQFIDLKNGEKFRLKNKSYSLYNYSALISGIIFALTLADKTPLWVVFVTGSLGILMAKLFFGGLGQNIFNPAALARVLVAVNFATLSTYEAHLAVIDGQAGATLLSQLNQSGATFMQGVVDSYPLWNLFTGIGIPGSIGEVSVLAILVGGIYLALRRSFEVRIPLIYIGTVFVLASAVALYEGVGIWYPLAHVMGGGLLFGAVYMATDPITSPITLPGRIYFAFGLGVLTFVIRLFGALPEGVVFSILIMNMFVASFDYYKWTNPRFSVKSWIVFALVVLLVIVSIILGLGATGLWYIVLGILILGLVLAGVLL
jgi:electron transport complex protein RnfD